MNPDFRLFLRCFAATALFALALLALVYLAIPPLQHAVPAEAPWPSVSLWSRNDVARALLGRPTDMAREGAWLLLICLAGSGIAFRQLRQKRREILLLRADMNRAFAARTEVAEEYRQHGELFDAILPLANELAERLALLDQRLAGTQVLDRGEYDVAGAPPGTARQLRDAFETLTATLARLEERVRALAPADNAGALAQLEETQDRLAAMDDVGGRLKRLGLNVALAGSRAGASAGFGPLAAEAKDIAGESAAVSAQLAAAVAQLTRSLRSTEPQSVNELATQLAQIRDFTAEQWPLLEALTRGDGDETLTLDIAASARRARTLANRIEQLTKREAA